MILVVADDLSGAAELAGIAFAHGLTAEVQTELQPRTEAQVICLDTDTRRLEPEAAAAGLRKLTRRLKAASPEFIFKKPTPHCGGTSGGAGRVAGDHSARCGRYLCRPIRPAAGPFAGVNIGSATRRCTKRISPGTRSIRRPRRMWRHD